MDHAVVSLQSVLIVLACGVAAMVICRSVRLPPMVGYLLTGLALGPHALGLVSDLEETRLLAEFGVVFLMFSIGLEFSLPRLIAMRGVVFGLGLAQVERSSRLSTRCGIRGQRAALQAAGISRAAAVVVAFADAAAAVRVLAHIHELNPAKPVVVRAREEADIERLTAAGASDTRGLRIRRDARLAHARVGSACR